MGKRSNRYFIKEDIQMANEHIKRCLPSYDIKEWQTKKITHLLTWLKLKTLTASDAGEDAEQQELSSIAFVQMVHPL